MSGGKPPLPLSVDDSQTMAKVAGLGVPIPVQATPVGSVPKQNTPLSG